MFGGTLKRHDFNAIKYMPGVRAAVEVPNGIAVVANSFWRAKTALEVMLIEWDFGVHVNANSETFRKTFREALDKPGVVAKEEGDALAAIKTAGKVVEADYGVPYLAHACMEPMNCMAQVRPERVDVWVRTHNPEAVLAAAVNHRHGFGECPQLLPGRGHIGEPGVLPIAPAVCNAVFKIAGKPIRSLPLRNYELDWG